MPIQTPADPSLPNIDESAAALNFEDKFRKIGFTILVIVIICALAGLFSSGYLSAQSQYNADKSVQVKYEKFGRLLKEFDLQIGAPVKNSAPLVLRLGQDFMGVYQLEKINPQPDKMYSREEALYLHYDHPASGERFTVWLTIRPAKPGRFTSTVAVGDRPELSLSQFIYP